MYESYFLTLPVPSSWVSRAGGFGDNTAGGSPATTQPNPTDNGRNMTTMAEKAGETVATAAVAEKRKALGRGLDCYCLAVRDRSEPTHPPDTGAHSTVLPEAFAQARAASGDASSRLHWIRSNTIRTRPAITSTPKRAGVGGVDSRQWSGAADRGASGGEGGIC